MRDGGLREDGEWEEDEEEVVVRRTCDAGSARLRQGIFSKLTTGSDTLRRQREKRRRECVKRLQD